MNHYILVGHFYKQLLENNVFSGSYLFQGSALRRHNSFVVCLPCSSSRVWECRLVANGRHSACNIQRSSAGHWRLSVSQDNNYRCYYVNACNDVELQLLSLMWSRPWLVLPVGTSPRRFKSCTRGHRSSSRKKTHRFCKHFFMSSIKPAWVDNPNYTGEMFRQTMTRPSVLD